MIKTQLLNLKKYQRRIGLYQKIVKRNISLYLTLVLYSVMSEVRRIQKRRKKQQNQKSLSRKVFEVLTYILQQKFAFEESILGCRKEITVQHEEICPCSNEENRTDNCTICNNTGKVLKKFIYDISIPRGIFSGQVLKIKGKGNVGINGGENGDLVINIQVKQKKGFVRTGQDVVYYMTISFPQAVLGAVINVPTAYGTVNCEIPAGIKPGEQLCLAGYFFKNC